MTNQMETHTSRSEDDDFMVRTRASDLRFCEKQLASLQRSRFRFADLFLAISTSAFGVALGAWAGGLTTASSLWWVFYTILPVIAAGTFVAYIHFGKQSVTQSTKLAEDILEHLPDVNNTRPSHPEYAKLAGQWDLDSRTLSSGKSSRGTLTVSVEETTVTVAGVLIGESGTKIAEMFSRIVSYDPSQKRFVFLYGYMASNDGGGLDSSECVYSGVVFDASSDLSIQGNWSHITGPAFAGTATLRKKE